MHISDVCFRYNIEERSGTTIHIYVYIHSMCLNVPLSSLSGTYSEGEVPGSG